MKQRQTSRSTNFSRFKLLFGILVLLAGLLLLHQSHEAYRGASWGKDSHLQTSTYASPRTPSFHDPYDPKLNPLSIPPGKAQNLPSIRVDDSQLDSRRRNYGGQGDKQHLGGFAEIDPGGISIPLWKHMIENLGVKSFLDIGCGRGFSTSWFVLHGADAMCAEGSHDGVMRSIVPDKEHRVVEHDFSRGPWWPEKTYDVAW